MLAGIVLGTKEAFFYTLLVDFYSWRTNIAIYNADRGGEKAWWEKEKNPEFTAVSSDCYTHEILKHNFIKRSWKNDFNKTSAALIIGLKNDMEVLKLLNFLKPFPFLDLKNMYLLSPFWELFWVLAY